MLTENSIGPENSAGPIKVRNSAAERTRLPIVVMVFFVGLVIPLSFYIGTIRLSIFRIVLILMFVPSIIILFSGKAGNIKAPDICVIIICLWSSISLIYHHGLIEKIEPIGIFFVDTMGAYLIGRCFIRTPQAFYKMVQALFIIMLLLAPFAVYEAITGSNIILKFFSSIGSTPFDVSKDRRWGLDRVQGPFGHPILWGVFFGTIVGVTHYVLGFERSLYQRLFCTFAVLIVAGLALSSGPLVALIAQAFFISWDWVFRRQKMRWYVLAALSLLAYILVDLLSNRNPFLVFVDYLAFDSYTAANRVLIFEWGMKNIFDNPVLGIGHNNWERLSWMTGSFDMFWLLFPMQHGVVVGVAYFTLFFWIFFKVVNKKISDPKISSYRVGYASSIVGFFVSGWTVHFWDATFALLLFFLGAGVWFVDYDNSARRQYDDDADKDLGRLIRYSRFDSAAI